MIRAWTWLNGRKTHIAAALLFLGAFIRRVLIGEFGMEAEWLPQAANSLDWLAGALYGIGIGHKIKKKEPVFGKRNR